MKRIFIILGLTLLSWLMAFFAAYGAVQLYLKHIIQGE